MVKAEKLSPFFFVPIVLARPGQARPAKARQARPRLAQQGQTVMVKAEKLSPFFLCLPIVLARQASQARQPASQARQG